MRAGWVFSVLALLFLVQVRAADEYALFINGSSLTMPSFPFGGGNWTWEGWMLPRTVRSFHFSTDVVVWEWGRAGRFDGLMSLRLRHRDRRLALTVRNGQASSSGKTLVTSRQIKLQAWTHVAVTFRDAVSGAPGSTETRIFFDGVLVDKVVSSLPVPTRTTRPTHRLGTGLSPAPGTDFDGLLDDVRIWSLARSDAEIASSYLTGPDQGAEGLELRYTFETLSRIVRGLDLLGGQATVVDESPNGRDATIMCAQPNPVSCRAKFGSEWAKTRCGDGKRSGTEACDDGNLVGGDGCSASCTVEAGFLCQPGAPGATDACIKGALLEAFSLDAADAAADWDAAVGTRRQWIQPGQGVPQGPVDGGEWAVGPDFRRNGERGLRILQKPAFQVGEDLGPIGAPQGSDADPLVPGVPIPDRESLAMWFRADSLLTTVKSGGHTVVTHWGDRVSGGTCKMSGYPDPVTQGMWLDPKGANGKPSIYHDTGQFGYRADATACPRVNMPFSVFVYNRYRSELNSARSVTSASWDYRIGMVGSRLGFYDSRRRGWVEVRPDYPSSHNYAHWRPHVSQWYLVSGHGGTTGSTWWTNTVREGIDNGGYAGDLGQLAISAGGASWSIGAVDVAEVLVYNRTVDDATRQKVEEYFQRRYEDGQSPAPAMVKAAVAEAPTDYVTQGSRLLATELEDPAGAARRSGSGAAATRSLVRLEWWVRLAQAPDRVGIPLVVMLLEEPDGGWGASGVPSVTKCGLGATVADPASPAAVSLCAGQRYVSICFGGGGVAAVPCDETRDVGRDAWSRQMLLPESAFAAKYGDAVVADESAPLYGSDGGVPRRVRLVLAAAAADTTVESWVDEIQLVREDQVPACPAVSVSASASVDYGTVARSTWPLAHLRFPMGAATTVTTRVGIVSAAAPGPLTLSAGVVDDVPSLLAPGDAADASVRLDPGLDHVQLAMNGVPKADVQKGFALTLWFEAPAYPSADVVLVSDRTGSGSTASDLFFSLSLGSGGELEASISTSVGLSTVRTAAAAWFPETRTHLGLNWRADLGEISILVDGVNQTTTATVGSAMTPNVGAPATSSLQAPLRLGFPGVAGTSAASRLPNLVVDELVVYNHPLTPAQWVTHAQFASPAWTAESASGGRAVLRVEQPPSVSGGGTLTAGAVTETPLLDADLGETGLAVAVLNADGTIQKHKKWPIFDANTTAAQVAVDEATMWIQNEDRIPVGALVAAAVRPGTALRRELLMREDFFNELGVPVESNYIYEDEGGYGLQSMAATNQPYYERGFPSTYQGAVDYCATSGRVLCNYRSYCGLSTATDNDDYYSIFGRPEGDQWAPYSGDGDNAWLYVGASFAEYNCKKYVDLNGAPPTWGTTTGPPAGGYVMCCSPTDRQAPWEFWYEYIPGAGTVNYFNPQFRYSTYSLYSTSHYFQYFGSYGNTRCTEDLYGKHYWYKASAALTWTDYVYELDIYTYVRDVGITFRMTDQDNYYRFTFNTDGNVNCVGFQRRKAGVWTRGPRIWNEQDPVKQIPSQSWIKLRLEVKGTLFIVFVDGVEVHRWDDNGGDALPVGSVGVWTAYSAGIHFDQIRVWSNNGTETHALDNALGVLGAPPIPSLEWDDAFPAPAEPAWAVLGRRRSRGFNVDDSNSNDTATTSAEREAAALAARLGELYPPGSVAKASTGTDGRTPTAKVARSFECPSVTVSIPENTPVGTAVDRMTALVPNRVPGFMGAIGGNLDRSSVARDRVGLSTATETDPVFDVERTGGRLTLRRDLLDFERRSSYDVTVAASAGPPRYDSGWFPMQSLSLDPKDTYKEVRLPVELANLDPARLRLRVQARVPHGPNAGYVFEAIGAAAPWGDLHHYWIHYGGLMTAYTSARRLSPQTAPSDAALQRSDGIVRLWAPSHNRFGTGFIFKVGGGAGATWDETDPSIFRGEANRQMSHSAEVRVIAEAEVPPDYDSGWMYLPANRRYQSQWSFEHGLEGFPDRARVLVRISEGPLAGYVFEARGDGMRRDPWQGYGGVIYQTTASQIRVDVASRYPGGSTDTHGAYVPEGFGHENTTVRARHVEVRAQAWRRASVRDPDFDTGWGNSIEFLRGGNAFAEVDISSATQGRYPERVEVWVRARDGTDIIVPAVGMPSHSGWTSGTYMGGVYPAVNRTHVRLWTVSADETAGDFPSTSNAPICSRDGWGGDYTAMYSSVVSVRVRVWADVPPAPTDVTAVRVNVVNLEEAPSVADVTATLPEYSTIGVTSTQNGTYVGTVEASDEDAGATLTYEILAGNELGLFALDPVSGNVTVARAAAISFEDSPVHDLVVGVDDSIFRTATLFRILIGDANDPVKVFPANFTLEENPEPNAIVGNPVESQDPDVDQTILYSIVKGNIGGAFAINKCSGQIRVDNPEAVNYEVNPVFHLRIRVEDDGVPQTTDETDVWIFLTDANDAPVFNATEVPFFTAPENALAGALVGRIPIFDEDNDTLIVGINAGDSSGYFTISVDGLDPVNGHPIYNLRMSDKVISAGDGTGRDLTPAQQVEQAGKLRLNFEDFNRPSRRFSLRFLAYDRDDTKLLERKTAISFFTVNVGDRNDAPIFNAQSLSTLESAAHGAPLTRLTTTDDDSLPLSGLSSRTDTHTFTVHSSGAAAFASMPFSLSASGVFSVDLTKGPTELDHETKSLYVVPVTVTDSGGAGGLPGPPLAVMRNISISVANVNEPPTVQDASFSVAENSEPGTVVGQVIASDPDQFDNLTYTIQSGDEAAVFGIDIRGVLTVAREGGVDYETTPSYSLTILVEDLDLLNATATVDITVEDRNDPPTWSDACDSSATPEFRRYPGRSTVQGLLYSPSQADEQSVFLLSQGVDFGGDWERCEAACASLSACAAYSLFGPNYPLTDWRGQCVGRTAFRSTNQRIDPSAVADSDVTVWAGVKVTICRHVSVAENSPDLTQLLGPSAGFPLDILDFEGDTFTVSVVDYSQLAAPSGPDTTDDVQDGYGVFAPELAGAGAGANGADRYSLIVTGSSQLDYERNSRFLVEMRAEDQGTGTPSSRAVVAVTVTDVDEAPSFVEQGTINRTVSEQDASGTIVGFPVQCLDDDTAHGDTLTYSISSGNGDGTFAIDGSSGQITLALNMTQTAPHTFSFEVTCTDSTGLTAVADVEVLLRDVNTRPRIVGAGVSRSVAENPTAGEAVGAALTVEDPDVGDTHTWSVVSVTPTWPGATAGADLFTIDAGTGQLRVGPKPPAEYFNYECHRLRPLAGCPTSTRTFRVRVAVEDDGEGTLSSFATVVISLTDRAEAPVVSESPLRLEVLELSEEGTVLAWAPGLSGAARGLLARIPDVYDDDKTPLTFSLVGGNATGLLGVRSVDGTTVFAAGAPDGGSGGNSSSAGDFNKYPAKQFPEFFLTSAGAAAADYETARGFTTTLRIQDAEGSSPVDVPVEVTVVDVLERPQLSQSAATATLEEGAPAGTVVFNVSAIASDPDGDELQYMVTEVIRSIPVADASAAGLNSTEEADETTGLLTETFVMDASEGVLRVRSSTSGDSVIDYERHATYYIRVLVADRANELDPQRLTVSMDLRVDVTDVNDVQVAVVSTPADTSALSTPGGQTITIRGSNLGFLVPDPSLPLVVEYGCRLPADAVPAGGDRTLPPPAGRGDDPFSSTCEFRAGACQFAEPYGAAITCTSAEGAGAGLAVRVRVGSHVRHSNPAGDAPEARQLLDYLPPAITRVWVRSAADGATLSAMGTRGTGTEIHIEGRDLGPAWGGNTTASAAAAVAAAGGLAAAPVGLTYDHVTSETGFPARR